MSHLVNHAPDEAESSWITLWFKPVKTQSLESSLLVLGIADAAFNPGNA